MNNISEFELDEIVLKISECFHAPMADGGISAVEGDGNKIKDILRPLLQSRQPEKVRVSMRGVAKLAKDMTGTSFSKRLDMLVIWLKSKGFEVAEK